MINRNDEDILNLLTSDDDRAYQLLVKSYATFVFNACLKQVPNIEEAEDLTQEVLLAAYLNLKSFQGRSRLSTWLYSIIINKCNEFYRNQNRLKRKGIEHSIDDENIKWSTEPSVEFDHPGVQLEKKEQTEILYHAIGSLPENQRIAYTLNKIDGQSYAEVAEIMDQTVSAVESLLFRANKNLRKLLADFYQKNYM